MHPRSILVLALLAAPLASGAAAAQQNPAPVSKGARVAADTALVGAAEGQLFEAIVRAGSARYADRGNPQLRAEHVRLLREFIARPVHVRRNLLRAAATSLFTEMQEAGGWRSREELGQTVEIMARDNPSLPAMTQLDAVVALADAAASLALAERLALELPGKIEAWIMDPASQRGHAIGVSDSLAREMALRQLQGPIHDALGAVYLAQGRLAQARPELEAALRAQPMESRTLRHMARLEEREGHRAVALLRTRQAQQLEAPNPLGLPTARATPSVMVPQRIYEPTPLPQFALHLLDAGAPLPSPFGRRPPTAPTGRIVTSDTLRGRVAVIQFWGIWCKPCVAELPEVQRAWQYVRDNPQVVFLTIDTGDPPDSLHAFMAQHHYDFPVLLDDGFAQRAGVVAYPSTLVLDRAGRKLIPTAGARVHDELVRLVNKALASGGPSSP